MKKKVLNIRFCSIIAMFIIISLFGLLSILLPKQTVSEVERRELASCPTATVESVLSGEFSRNFEAFYADTFPFRDKFVELANTIESLHGVRFDDVRIVTTTTAASEVENEEEKTKIEAPEKKNMNKTVLPNPVKKEEKKELPKTGTKPVKTDPVKTETAAPAVEEKKETEKAPLEEIEEEPLFELERSGAVFIYGNIAFEIYGGNEAAMESYANVINRFRDELPGDVTLYSIIVPSSAEFFLPKKYRDSSEPQQPLIEHAYSCLNPDVLYVDVLSVLKEHKDEYIYFRTDHHWTGLGAYYGYTAFCQRAGFTPLDYDKYEKGRIDDFLGTLYSSTRDPELAKTPDYVEYCHVPVETKSSRYEKDAQSYAIDTPVLATFAKGVNAYSVYLYGDYPRFDIDNLESSNGRNVLVIKESYGNSFAPYLIPNYDNVYVVDLRYYRLNVKELIEKKNITDVIIINNAFAAATKKHRQSLEALLTY